MRTPDRFHYRFLPALFIPILLSLVIVSCTDDPIISGDEFLTPATKATIQHLLDSTAEAAGIPGGAIGLRLVNGEEWYTRVGNRRAIFPYDSATAADTMPWDAQFRIGSITKTFTATVVLQLVDEGKFTLDTKVSQILPDLTMRYFSFDTITVRDLLQHTSGIQNYTNSFDFSLDYLRNRQRQWTPQELIVFADSLGIPPSDAYAPYPWLYSNTNYIILGLIIEKVTGRTASQEITTRIIDRLHMTHTIFATSAEPTLTMAEGYSDFSCDDYKQAPFFPGRGEEYDNITVLDPSQGWTAGAVISTTADLMNYVEALADGTLLSENMQKARFTNMLPAGKDGASGMYGLGIALIDANWIGHKGGFNGYDLSMYTKPGVGTLVVLTNIGGTGCANGAGPILFKVITFNLFGVSPDV